MSKAIVGVAELGGAVALGALTAIAPVTAVFTAYAIPALLSGAVSNEMGALADLLTQNRGEGITIRQPAANRGVIYGQWRVGGVLDYISTTGSGPGTLNQIIVIAGHEIEAFCNAYFDGTMIVWDTTDGNPANQTVGGYNFGGWANDQDVIGPDGLKRNFGSNVFVSAYYGTQTLGTVDGNILANDPNWATPGKGTPSGVGCAYVYAHARADASLFPDRPETRFTVLGKNDVFDPLTNTRSWTQNAALIIADFLTNTEFGCGFSQDAINTDQLVAAANVCDELVDLAAGGTELRYTINTAFDSSSNPGDTLTGMLAACAGRLVQAGGQLYIVPGYYQGPSFTWDESSLVDTVDYKPYRSKRSLFNHVSATFTAPNYPYASTDAGSVGSSTNNLYDSNGYGPDGTTQNNFGLEWQPASAPSYACDVAHGYTVDTYTTEDGGVELWQDMDLKCVLSVATAQRLMKITLLRNRFQNSAKLSMIPEAYGMIPLDVMEMTFAPVGWTNMQLEVTSTGLMVKEGSGDDSQGDSLYCPVSCQITDPSIYEWDATTEEQTILATPAGVSQIARQVAPPTDVELDSGENTAVISLEGIKTPRIAVTWTAPADPAATRIQIQYQLTGATSWITAPAADITSLQTYIDGVVAGSTYNVQVRTLRSNNAASVWVAVSNYTVSTTYSSITSLGINPNSPYNVNNDSSLSSTPDADGKTVDINVYGPGGVGTAWDNFTGQGQSSYPAATLTGFLPSTEYTVIYDVANDEYSALTNFNETLSDSFITIGTTLTCTVTGTGGATGGGGGGVGPRQPGCTLEGTMLDGASGHPIDNRIIKSFLDRGSHVYLRGRNGHLPGKAGCERVMAAEWIEVDHLYRVTVGETSFECSGSHTLRLESGYDWVENIESGSMVETLTGYAPATIERVEKAGRVLRLHLDGPHHEYSVGGVMSHNAKIPTNVPESTT